MNLSVEIEDNARIPSLIKYSRGVAALLATEATLLIMQTKVVMLEPSSVPPFRSV